ncbi:MAG: NlpC/P60 family protein [Acidimicrobiales bacterium]
MGDRRCDLWSWSTTKARVAAAVMVVGVMAAPTAQAAPLDDARARARAIEAELDRTGRALSVQAEAYNRSRLEVAQIDESLRQASADVTRADGQMSSVRRALAAAAVDAYVSGSATGTMARLRGSTDQMVVRHQYLRVTSAGHHQLAGQLRAAREDLSRTRTELGARQVQARKVELTQREARQRVADAEVAQKRVLAGVKGEIARLVAEEQNRREAEAARRAQAARQAALAGAPSAGPVGRSANPAAAAPRPAAAPAAAAAAAGSLTRGAPVPPPSGPASGRVESVIAEARKQLGKPYVWGGSGPNNFDCSGLTGWAWRVAGVRLSHSAYLQYTETARVPVNEVQPGDLLFFGPNVRGIHHNALYIGNGQMIEASQSGTPVRIRGWRAGDLVGVGRPG